MHQFGPCAESYRIDRQNWVSNKHLVEPVFEFLSLHFVLFTGYFDTRLNLPNSYSRQIEPFRRGLVNPVQNGRMRTGTPQF